MTVQVVRYGASPDQEGDLHLPAAGRPPVVCLLHGGFWRMPWARDQMNAMAVSLVAAGLAVWNLEYRRLGVPGAGWPGTMEDVAAGIEHLARLAGDGIDLDLERVIVAGHSAGGHLDDTVPIAHSRRYAQAAVAAGDSCELIELPGTGHMEFLDPASEAFAAFVGRLTELLAAR